MMRRDAIISNDGLYRYRLERTWDLGKPKCLYVMLNPSDADDKIDDRTIKACIRFAQDWGYGGLMVGNLFAYRSPYPRKLKTVDDPIGPENDLYLAAMLSEADKVIAAWGNGDNLQGRDAVVLSLLEAPPHAEGRREAPMTTNTTTGTGGGQRLNQSQGGMCIC